MNTKEFQYQGMLVNGFLMLFLNLLVIPALVVSSFLVFGSESAVTIAATVLLSILFILITPGYFSQEPNEARVMVFFGKYEGTFTSTGFFWVNPFMNNPIGIGYLVIYLSSVHVYLKSQAESKDEVLVQ